MPEWLLEESEFFAGRFKRYQRRHPAATAAALNNLDTYLKTLNAGVKPPLIQAGFIHREPQGVVAIDQRGAKGRPRQTRLYMYAVAMERVLYLITIGDKDSQKRDLADCRKFVNSLRKRG